MSDLTPEERVALGQLQNDEAAWAYFFDRAKSLKWFYDLRDRGLFSPAMHPSIVDREDGGVEVPSWPALSYLEKVADQLPHPENAEYRTPLAEIIREVTEHLRENGESNHRTWWHFAKFLSRIGAGEVALGDLELVDYWLSDPISCELCVDELGGPFLQSLLDSQTEDADAIAFGLLKILLKFGAPGRGRRRRRDSAEQFRFDDFYAKRIFDGRADQFVRRFGVRGVDLLLTRLGDALDSDNPSHSAIWRPAIEDHDQNRPSDDAIDILVPVVRDWACAAVESNSPGYADLISQMLRNPHPVIRRIAIYVISVRPEALSALVSSTFRQELFSSEYRYEVYGLLSAVFSSLGEGTRSELVEKIKRRAKSSVDPDRPERVQSQQEAYEGLRWLHAIRGSDDPTATALTRNYLDLTGGKWPEHPRFSSYWSVGRVPHGASDSDAEARDLLTSDSDSLVSDLRRISDEGGPTPQQARALRDAIKASPSQFQGQLLEFADTHFSFVAAIVEAYHQLWIGDQYSNWSEVVEFCLAVAERFHNEPKFSGPQRADAEGRENWQFAREIGDLIIAADADDTDSLGNEILARSLLTVALLAEALPRTAVDTSRECVTAAINSPRGRCMEAAIRLALRIARVATEQSGEDGRRGLWVHFFQTRFDAELYAPRGESREFRTLVGMYLPNLLYLGRSHVEDALGAIFSNEDPLGWECAMAGYSFVSRIDPKIYSFLASNGHFARALDSEAFSQSAIDRFVENVSIGYLEGDEAPDDPASLIQKLVRDQRPPQLGHLIWFLWHLREGADRAARREKIMPLWRKIAGGPEPKSDDQRSVRWKSLLWLSYLDELDEESTDLVQRCISHTPESAHAFELPEELARLSKQSPIEVGLVYGALLEAGVVPTYPQDQVVAAVRSLYDAGEEGVRLADQLAEGYYERRIYFLRDLQAEFRGIERG